MPTRLRVRTLQALFGLTYAALALVAIARSPGLATSLSAIALGCLAYLSSRAVPDRLVTLEEAMRLSPIAFAVIGFGVAADSLAGLHAVGWAAVVMPYCAGNRMRAAGLGRWASNRAGILEQEDLRAISALFLSLTASSRPLGD